MGWLDGNGTLAEWVSGVVTAGGIIVTLAYDRWSRRAERRRERSRDDTRTAEGVTVWLGGSREQENDFERFVVAPHAWVHNANDVPVFLQSLRLHAFGATSEDELASVTVPPQRSVQLRIGEIDENGLAITLGWEVTRPELLLHSGFKVNTWDRTDRDEHERAETNADRLTQERQQARREGRPEPGLSIDELSYSRWMQFIGELGFTPDEAHFWKDMDDNASLCWIHRSALRNFVASITFVDPAGRRWVRDSTGRLRGGAGCSEQPT